MARSRILWKGSRSWCCRGELILCFQASHHGGMGRPCCRISSQVRTSNCLLSGKKLHPSMLSIPSNPLWSVASILSLPTFLSTYTSRTTHCCSYLDHPCPALASTVQGTSCSWAPSPCSCPKAGMEHQGVLRRKEKPTHHQRCWCPAPHSPAEAGRELLWSSQLSVEQWWKWERRGGASEHGGGWFLPAGD